MCACPANFITDTQAGTAPCTPQPRALQFSCGRPLEARQPPADPCPPPPLPDRSGHSGGVPSGPPVYAGSSTATRAPSPGRLQGRAALSVPWSPSSCRPLAPWADGPVQDSTTCASSSHGVWTPPVVRPGSAPPCLMQSWSRWQHVSGQEAACPDRILPQPAQRQAPMASLPGPGAPGNTVPPTCVPPPPPRASTSSSQGPVVADPGTHPTTSQGQARHSRVTRPARATQRHGGISLPCVPPRGTGAVNSPAGLGTGQPRFA